MQTIGGQWQSVFHKMRFLLLIKYQNTKVFSIFAASFLIVFTIANMKEKLLKALSERCKDMGLTRKALDELVEIGSEGLATDASDEDINKSAIALARYAKLTQAEITRKTRSDKRKQSQSKDASSDNEGDDEGDNNNVSNDIQAMIDARFKKYDERVLALESENAALKKEKAQAERQSEIADKAKKLGIPDYLVRRMSFADDADIDEELEAVRQDMVNNNLVPKSAAHESGKVEEAMKADAKAWANTLPSMS